jgi:N-sulfoglucosamine sulfohydrolase
MILRNPNPPACRHHAVRAVVSLMVLLGGGLAVIAVPGGRSLGDSPLAAAEPTPANAAGGRPNIVLFVTDDQSPDAGCYGNHVVKTPNLDRLAADGTCFDQAFCTTASCSASRSVILTGWYNHANAQYGHEHSYHHFRTYDRVRSLPVLLNEAGYRTARIGKYHVGPEQVYKFDRALPGNARSPVEMADNCRPWIEGQAPEAAGSKPFFLYFCTADPHRSGGTVPDAHYNPNPFGNRPQGYPGVDEQPYDPAEVPVHSFLPDTPVCREELAQYYQSVSRIDQGLGRLIQHLKQAGVYDNTLIIYTSDHGIAFPGGKTTVYEGGLRVPFVVRSPAARQRGNRSQALVSLVDLTPTILDFAGCLPKDYSFHGRSFKQIADQEKPEGWDEVYASHTFHEITMYYPMRVVRNRRYKLIWNVAHGLPYPFASDLWAAPTWQDVYRNGPSALYGKRTVDAYLHRPRFELYDLQQDPDEIHNLADSTEHAELLAQLQDKLRKFQKRTKDPWLLKWDYE